MQTREPILVVDDHEETVDMLQRLLEAHGHRVIAVTSAVRALELMKQGLRPSAILTDERMPHVSGSELLGYLRGEARLCQTPVLLLSAAKVAQKGDPLTVVRRKPVDPDSLLDLVDRLVH